MISDRRWVQGAVPVAQLFLEVSNRTGSMLIASEDVEGCNRSCISEQGARVMEQKGCVAGRNWEGKGEPACVCTSTPVDCMPVTATAEVGTPAALATCCRYSPMKDSSNNGSYSGQKECHPSSAI